MVQLIVSCEHGGNRVPREYRAVFLGYDRLLESHRGYDKGALHTAQKLAQRFDAPIFAATVSRLVIDLNRSLGHANLLSPIMKSLGPGVRQHLIDTYYAPHRAAVEDAITRLVKARERVLHLAMHSFTPMLNGQVRHCDIGLLYDPQRSEERAWARRSKKAIARLAPDLQVRCNYPYRGTSDGLTTALRRRFGARSYVGIEIEINQRHVVRGGTAWRGLQEVICRACNAFT